MWFSIPCTPCLTSFTQVAALAINNFCFHYLLILNVIIYCPHCVLYILYMFCSVIREENLCYTSIKYSLY